MMGRELDARLAYKLDIDITAGMMRIDWRLIPKFSTDGNAMLKLGREMRKRGWLVVTSIKENDCTSNYYKPIGDDPYNTEKMFISKADTEPLARALAAYYALTGREWEEDKCLEQIEIKPFAGEKGGI